MITTLNEIREYEPCKFSWKKLLAGLGKTCADNDPLPLSKVLEINGLSDALWCLKVITNADREIRLFAVNCVLQVQGLTPEELKTLEIVEKFANGQVTSNELRMARIEASGQMRNAIGFAVFATTSETADMAAWGACSGAARAAGWRASYPMKGYEAKIAAWNKAVAQVVAKQGELFIKHFGQDVTMYESIYKRGDRSKVVLPPEPKYAPVTQLHKVSCTREKADPYYMPPQLWLPEEVSEAETASSSDDPLVIMLEREGSHQEAYELQQSHRAGTAQTVLKLYMEQRPDQYPQTLPGTVWTSQPSSTETKQRVYLRRVKAA